MAVDPLIELHDVNEYYGELHVLQDIDLTVGKGEVVVVIGPSGSGKSTLRRTVDRPGTVLARLRTGVGMTVPQDVSLGQTKVRGRKKEKADDRSRRLLGRVVGLAGQAPEFPRALAMEPKALLFDESTSTLDPEMANEVLSDGRVIEDRAPEEFFTDPHGERAEDFLSKILEH
ncbi:ATP-binding cassette domain-containing protein [Streptomyces sp. NPDC001351]|uniref:ATP-binding cassette domain-containing protein n=1 Tax=Streptomyces sp. NPDC001351 TaxID=3364564 RepID=UPI00368D1C25